MKPRILFVLHLPPPVHGAAVVGRYIQDSKIINSTFDCRYINLSIAASLEDIQRVGFRKLMNFISLLLTIRKEVKSFKPDLVYVTPNTKDGPFYKDCTVVEWLKLLGCKVVAHFHNKGVSMRQEHWLDDKLYSVFFNHIKVIILADTLYLDIKKYVKRDSVFVCPNGIPNVDYEYRERKNDVPRLLFLSNLIESKGVIVLLDALKQLLDEGYKFECDFVGDETAEIDRCRFEAEVAARHLKDYVTYHGKKYGEEKTEYFFNADIFLFPTFYDKETFGLVNLEAMSYALPVISTDEGGIPDVVRHGVNGLICAKKDATALADCIKKLLDNPDLRVRMGKAGREIFSRYFTLDRFEENMKSILESILLSNGRDE